MRTVTGFAVYALGLLGLGLLGCEQVTRIDDKGTGGGGVPDAVQAVFDARCATASCHDATTRAQGLDLSAGASAAIIGQTATQSPLPLVELGNVSGSYFALKLMVAPPSPIVGVRMPQGGDFSDPALLEDLALVLGWIAGAELPGGGGGTTGDGTSSESGTADTSTGDVIMLCGIDDLKAGAENPIVAGDGAMEIPTAIGEILAANCGCHYADDLDRPVGDINSEARYQISTWAEWQRDIADGLSTQAETLRRLDPEPINSMPPPSACNVGDGQPMDPAARQTLVDWIMAGTPDGASWMP